LFGGYLSLPVLSLWWWWLVWFTAPSRWYTSVGAMCTHRPFPGALVVFRGGGVFQLVRGLSRLLHNERHFVFYLPRCPTKPLAPAAAAHCRSLTDRNRWLLPARSIAVVNIQVGAAVQIPIPPRRLASAGCTNAMTCSASLHSGAMEEHGSMHAGETMYTPPFHRHCNQTAEAPSGGVYADCPRSGALFGRDGVARAMAHVVVADSPTSQVRFRALSPPLGIVS
jgi:hypothetical protein